MIRSRLTASVVALAIELIVAACQAGSGSPIPSADLAVHPPPNAHGIAWVSDDLVVVGYQQTATDPTRLATVHLGDGSIEALPAPAACERVFLHNPVRRTDDSIYLTATCIAMPESGGTDRTTVEALVLTTGEYESLASAGDPGGSAGALTVDPTGTRYLLDFGQLCGVIVEASDAGPLPVDLDIVGGGGSFSLADLRPGPDCRDRGWAAWPAWGPTGEIAFFASTDAIGLDGAARGTSPASLYIADDEVGRATPLVDDVIVPRGLAWSPDGASLAFGGEIGGRKATWLVDRASGTLREIHDARAAWLAWSPDGTRIAALIRPDGETSSSIVTIPIQGVTSLARTP